MVDNTEVVPLDDIQANECLNYIKIPVAILDRETKALDNKVVPLVKVQQRHRKGSDWTWGTKSEMREHYLELFTSVDFENRSDLTGKLRSNLGNFQFLPLFL